MYDGNQVLRFESKYKASDLGGLGVELVMRKGTGNYDKDRTIFNYSYIPLSKPTLQEQVYSKLKENKIYYNDGKNTNLLNGAIVTSGKEFFQSLGMKFKDSGRTHQVGKDKGKTILVPDIKSKEDIPEKVMGFFNESYNFLEQLVGKDNVVYAEIHFDEDTPHLHFYFMPIVNVVKRKVFETDKDGNLIYREGIDKKGNKKMYPVQKKDENGKNIFKTEEGKFLNCDQFWKTLGGKTSYAKIQDDYNKFITEKGYNLYRGNIGDNKHHKTKAEKEIEDLIGLDCSEAVEISAKSGLNVDKVLEEIVHKLPSPKGDKEAPTQALVFDSFYDSYRGIIAFVSVKNGTIKPKDKIRFMATGAEYEVTEVGVRTPKEVVEDQLNCGDVGWVSAAIKNIEDVRVGDTITVASNPASEPLSGYREMHPMVYCGLYPVDNARYDDLKEALSKLKLNDAALHYEPETSQALGFGFRCGFLGLLHMDVVEERLEREYNLSLIATSPSVIYHVYKTDGTMEEIDNPSALPEPQKVDHIEEPYVKCDIMVPKEFVGPMMDLCQKKRGEYVDLQVLDDVRMMMVYQMPLSEIIYDFFDKMKSCTKGYASFDYEFSGYRTSSLVKMDILLNGQIVDALSTIVFRDFAYNRGNAMAVKLKDLIPKQQFEIPVQAAIGGKIIARTNIKALRKNVLAKCYGGDISRKKKLLEKQKEGKKRMKMVGSVEIPQEAFMAVLSMDDD